LTFNVIRIHEAVDTGYPFVLGVRGYTRREALEFVKMLSVEIDISRRHGKSDYVIEWWNRTLADAGRDCLVISMAPPGLYELSM
jgi:hypothetical protein